VVEKSGGLFKRRFRITDLGLRTAWFCTRTYSRILRPGFVTLLPQVSPPNACTPRTPARRDIADLQDDQF
jgi:hypothetical protein